MVLCALQRSGPRSWRRVASSNFADSGATAGDEAGQECKDATSSAHVKACNHPAHDPCEAQAKARQELQLQIIVSDEQLHAMRHWNVMQGIGAISIGCIVHQA